MTEPQKDYYWDYTMGFPEDNGMIKTTNNTVNISMESDGLKINTANGNSHYVTYWFPDPAKRLTTGTVEVQFIGHMNGGNNALRNLLIRIGNNDFGACITTSRNRFKLYDDASQPGGGTDIMAFTSDVKQTVKLVLKGETFDFYVNGVKKLSDKPATGMQYSAITGIWAGNITSPSYWVKLCSIKVLPDQIE